MSRLFIFLALFFTLACASGELPRPAAASGVSPGPAPASEGPIGKATRGGGGRSPHIVELAVDFSGPEGVESAILLNITIQNCLRQGLDPRDQGFSVDLSGEINAAGKVEQPRIVAANLDLKACLTAALKGLGLAAGPTGGFRLRLQRPEAVESGRKGKTFQLDLAPQKKFE